MANVPVNSRVVLLTQARTTLSRPTTSAITKKVIIYPRYLVSGNTNRNDVNLQIAPRTVHTTTCFTPEIISASMSNIPTGFTFGYVAGVPYISIVSLDGSVTYMTIYGNSGLRSRLSTAWEVPSGVTQVRVRIGSGGSKAQSGHVISLSQPKLEFDPQDGSPNGPTGYTPGRP